jgi:hypothetical protein
MSRPRQSGGMPRRYRRLIAVAAVGLALGCAGAALGAWTVALNAGSTAEGQSPAKPPAPATPTAACSTGTKVTVSWTALTGAKNYTVYDGPSATGPWTSLSTVTTTSFTTASLTPAGTYYFAVVMTTNDANWPSSAQSTASAPRTITATTCA